MNHTNGNLQTGGEKPEHPFLHGKFLGQKLPGAKPNNDPPPFVDVNVVTPQAGTLSASRDKDSGGKAVRDQVPDRRTSTTRSQRWQAEEGAGLLEE